MCLAVPGRVLELSDGDPLARVGRVDFGGVVKEINFAFAPEAEIGAYVLVHVGFAIAVIDQAEAARIFADLTELADLAEREAGAP